MCVCHVETIKLTYLLTYWSLICAVAAAVTEVIVRYPKFDGTGYLALPVLRGAEQQFVIEVDFRPDVDMTSSSGTPPGGRVQLLMFSSDRDDAQFDFFSVSRLRNGQIEFRFVIVVLSLCFKLWLYLQ